MVKIVPLDDETDMDWSTLENEKSSTRCDRNGSSSRFSDWSYVDETASVMSDSSLSNSDENNEKEKSNTPPIFCSRQSGSYFPRHNRQSTESNHPAKPKRNNVIVAGWKDDVCSKG